MIYHLDGVGQLPYLDKILEIPELTGIQWVPGDGKPLMGDEVWMPVYKKIQAAGKNIEAGTTPELTAKMYRELDPKGLYVSTGYLGKIWAEFYLPPFLGGLGGIDEEPTWISGIIRKRDRIFFAIRANPKKYLSYGENWPRSESIFISFFEE